MKKKLFFVLGLLMAVVVQAQTYWNGTSNKVFSGSGTQADPYLIGTAEQLAGLAERTNVDKENFAGKYIKLTADIYLTNFSDPDTANWKEWIPIARTNRQQQSGGGSTTDYSYFSGHFDGDGHTIYNLYYNGGAGWGDDWDPDDPLFDPAAFIGALDLNAWDNALFTNVKGGTIENLNMANGHMCGIQGTSFLANNTTDGAVVRNCHVQGYFRGTGDMYPAGLVAYNYGLIENCSANVTTQGSGGASLVYTNNQGGVIRNCTATGTITPLGTSAAGLVYRNEGLIEQSQSSVAIIGLTDSRGFGCRGGGFCWLNDIHGTIRECVATGNITATAASRGQYYAASGFCVVNIGRIESSYCTGDLIDISATTGFEPAMASFVGQNGDAGDAVYRGPGTILNCFSTSKYIYNSTNFGAGACGFMKGSGYQTYSWLYPEAFISRNAFCWYNDDELSATDQIDIRPYCEARSSAYLHSQAFVDTLNLCASFLGTSQWELRNGLPQPTGVYVKNTSVFFAGGDGTKENPYLISNKAQLENFRWMINHGCYDFCGEYIKQTADIALNAPMSEWGIQMPEEWIPIGGFVHSHPHFRRSGDVETAFRGVYDGDFHEIKNMYIDNIRTCQGFFGSIGGTGFNGTTNMVAIRNLGVTDAYVVASNTSGILAGAVGATFNFPQVLFLQCHTSGQITSVNGYGYPVGAIAGDESECLWLNCTSSAKVSGHASDIGDIWGGKVYLHNDTIVNYLFTGILNDGSSAGINYAYGYNRNVFEDGAAANITTDGHNPNGVRPTAYLQSKEYVNVLNYAVSYWNDSHNEELQMDYWEWQEGNYPKLTKNPSYTPVVVTFNSNGGSAVVSKTVVPGSRIEMPVRPLKEGQLFSGWYKDAGLTQIFDFYKDSVQSDMTLYARWRNDQRFDVDITPFNNKFTDIYHITTAAQLRGFAQLQNGIYDWSSGSPVQTAAPRDFTGKTIVLDNDIMLGDTTDWQYWGRGAYGLPWKSIGSMTGYTGESRYTVAFNGTFDGQGHVIYGLYVEQGGMPGIELSGLFGWTGDDAVIQNVGVEASVLDAQAHNSIGVADDHSWYYSSTQDMSSLGMLGGHANSAKFKQCYGIGRIYSSTLGYGAGLIYNASDSVVNCYARIDMYQDDKTQRDSLEQSGAFSPSNNCSSRMVNCYNAGKTKTVGMSGTTSYYNKELVVKPESGAKVGKTTFEMHTMNAYAGWDFENVWARNDDYNDGYPVLRVFHPGIQNSPDPITVTGITLQETNVTIIAGDSIQLHASVVPANAANQKIYWTSSYAKVTVDENGFVRVPYFANTSLDPVIITATTDDGSYAKKCTLNITCPTIRIASKALYSRRVGDTEWIPGHISEPNDYATYYTLNWEYIIATYTTPMEYNLPSIWSVDDETRLTIEPLVDDTVYTRSGSTTEYRGSMAIIRGIGSGKVVLSVTNEKGANIRCASSTIVKQHNATSVSLDKTSVSVAIGATTLLTPSVTPVYTSYVPEYTWVSSDERVATVDNGVVTGINVGTANITVSARDYSATCVVKVTNPQPTYYTIRFLNYNGAVLQNSQVLEGDMPSYTGATPIKPADSEYTYSFNGWSPAIVAATANADYTAQFTATAKPQGGSDCDPYVCDFTKKSGSHTAYTDSWTYDNDWTVFGGANNGGQWDYVKMGGKNTNIANANPVYVVNKSAFDCAIASVKVTFPAGSFSKSGMSCNNWGVKVYSDLACNNLLYTVHGGTISKNAETLTVTPAAGQTWSAGYAIQVYWDLANTSTTNGIVLVSKIEYIPAASSTPVDPTYYTIRFLNWDDTELQNTLVLEGAMPSYTGATPTKPADDEYTYSFNGWSPTIVAATADADYTAQFTATTKPQGGGDCENVQAMWLQTGGTDLGEMTTDDATVWTYNSQYGAYGKKQGGATGWLLTPANNLSGMESVTLTFSHAHRYATNFADEMTLWVTPDYQGSVSASQWQQLTISPYAANTNWNFVDVTVNVPTSAVGDNTVFGFKYMSTASGYATWEIKNLTLNARCANTTVDVQTIEDGSVETARKVLINGQLFILRNDGIIFDARGVRVK